MGGVDRYAFSVVWEFTPDLDMVGTWFGRTVIHNAHQLYYEQAQDVFDGVRRPELAHLGPDGLAQLRGDLGRLVAIARKMRGIRFENGALELASVEVKFSFGASKGQQASTDDAAAGDSGMVPRAETPAEMHAKVKVEMMPTIEEFMLLANKSVATRVFATYPRAALLRRHPLPHNAAFRDLLDFAALQVCAFE